MAFVNLPTTIQNLLQVGILEREMEEGMDSVLAFRNVALVETIPNRVGETLTRTRAGRAAPVTTPMDPATNTGLDNGLTPVNDLANEQYTFTMSQYGYATDVNLMADQATIASVFIQKARNNAVQAAQSLERIMRAKLFSAYLSGNTRVLASPGSTTTTAHVDDVRGFQTVIVNGQVVVTSVSHPSSVTEYGPTGAAVQTLVVTSVAVDGSNVSTTPGGVSGTLTFSTATAPTAANALIASDGPAIFRAGGRLTSNKLTSTDVFSLSLVLDAEAYMRDNGVPLMADGTYHCILDNTSMRHLYADPQFMALFAGREQSMEYREGQVIQLCGVTFVPTTETYVTGITNDAAETVRIRRPILVGAENSIQGNFQGMETFLGELGMDTSDTSVVMVDGVLQIVREPLDRLQNQVSLAWTWIGDFAVPTDITATTTTIPTASSARYKRCAVLEHIG